MPRGSGLLRESSILIIVAGLLITYVGGRFVFEQVRSAEQAAQATELMDTGGEGFLPYVAPAMFAIPTATPGSVPTVRIPTNAPGDERTPTPAAATPTPEIPREPDRIVIPAIGLDAPVVRVGYLTVTIGGEDYNIWKAPDMRAAGWHENSAPLGVAGNTVLNGHHNIYGEVFRNLINLREGDLIQMVSGAYVYPYRVTSRAIVAEHNQPLEVRAMNATWIRPMDEDRLTLITCHPYWSNLQRLIIVAVPVTQ